MMAIAGGAINQLLPVTLGERLDFPGVSPADHNSRTGKFDMKPQTIRVCRKEISTLGWVYGRVA